MKRHGLTHPGRTRIDQSGQDQDSHGSAIISRHQICFLYTRRRLCSHPSRHDPVHTLPLTTVPRSHRRGMSLLIAVSQPHSPPLSHCSASLRSQSHSFTVSLLGKPFTTTSVVASLRQSRLLPPFPLYPQVAGAGAGRVGLLWGLVSGTSLQILPSYLSCFIRSDRYFSAPSTGVCT